MKMVNKNKELDKAIKEYYKKHTSYHKLAKLYAIEISVFIFVILFFTFIQF